MYETVLDSMGARVWKLKLQDCGRVCMQGRQVSSVVKDGYKGGR